VTNLDEGTTYNIVISSNNGMFGQETGLPSHPLIVTTPTSKLNFSYV